MSVMHHLFHKVKKSEVITYPFPHIIIKNPIDDELCSKLIDHFPYISVLTKGFFDKKIHFNNQRLSYPALPLLNESCVHPLFKDFLKINLSEDFFNKFISLFKESILSFYPDFEEKFNEFEKLKVGIKNLHTFEQADVLLNAMTTINTPVINKPSIVRDMHVDAQHKLFSGLFYMRLPGDDSIGGDLDLYKLKNKKNKFYGPYIKQKYIEKINTIKYEKNVFVLFVNGIDAIHGISPRYPTRYPRYYLHLSADLERPLYDLKQYQGVRSRIVSSFQDLKNSIFSKNVKDNVQNEY